MYIKMILTFVFTISVNRKVIPDDKWMLENFPGMPIVCLEVVTSAVINKYCPMV